MSKLMMQPSRQIVDRYEIPRTVLREAYGASPANHRRIAEAVAKVRGLCEELEIVSPRTIPLWKHFHLWPEDSPTG
jgi:hypothetical protein